MVFNLGQLGRILVMREMPRFVAFPAFRVPGLGHDQTLSFIPRRAWRGGGRYRRRISIVKRHWHSEQLYFPLCVNGKAGQRPAASAAEAFAGAAVPDGGAAASFLSFGDYRQPERRDLCEIAIGEELHHLWAGLRIVGQQRAQQGDALRILRCALQIV